MFNILFTNYPLNELSFYWLGNKLPILFKITKENAPNVHDARFSLSLIHKGKKLDFHRDICYFYKFNLQASINQSQNQVHPKNVLAPFKEYFNFILDRCKSLSNNCTYHLKVFQ